MSLERDPDFDAISEKDIFEEARDRLQLAVTAESTNRSLARNDMLFREGDPATHWDSPANTTTSEDEPELIINLTDALVRRVVNNIKQQRPRGKCHPVGDGADVELAEVINGIGRHVETRSEAGVAYDTAAESAVTAGWGYLRIVAEYIAPDSFLRDLRIIPIKNIFTVYMDPAAIMPTGSDANWVIITVKMRRTEYKRQYPRRENANWNDVGSLDNREWEDREHVRLAEYFRIREVKDKLYKVFNAATLQTKSVYESQMPDTLEPGESIVDERESSRRRVEWFTLNGTMVIDREIIPGEWIPVVRCEGNAVDIDGDVKRRGMVRSMADPQRMVNYGEVAKIKRLGLAPKSPWVAAEGQLDGHPEWDSANTQPYSVMTYKPVTVPTAQGDVLIPPPARQPPAQIEAGFSEFVQGMRTNLLAVAGMPHEPGADMQGQVISGIAQKRREMLSDQSHFQYYDNLTLCIAQVWRIMVQWIPVYFAEPGRIQRIIGEDGTPELVTLKENVQEGAISKLKNDLSVGRYDVVMDTGPGYETKREEGAENLIEMLKVQALAEIIAKTGPDLVFRSIDHPYMQELADRLAANTPDGLKKIMEGMSSRAKSIVQALANENAALKKNVQDLQMEQKYGLAKAHLQAEVKAHDTEETNKTKRIDTQVRADTSRFDTIVKSHTELAKEEIAAGASLLNTHAEAKHHLKEAEMMIEQGQKAEQKAGG